MSNLPVAKGEERQASHEIIPLVSVGILLMLGSSLILWFLCHAPSHNRPAAFVHLTIGSYGNNGRFSIIPDSARYITHFYPPLHMIRPSPVCRTIRHQALFAGFSGIM